MATSKREFALHLVEDALTECGVSSDDIQHITEALDDEQAAILKQSKAMFTGALKELR